MDLHDLPGVDVVHDLTKFPWPFKPESVEEVVSSHFLEHVPGRLRVGFFDELYRVMVSGKTATFVVPYWSSMRSVQDPTHEWPPIAETSFLYFNREWREANGLAHYLGQSDFDFSYAYLIDGMWNARNDETRMFAVRNYNNAVNDLQVTLTKRPK